MYEISPCAKLKGTWRISRNDEALGRSELQEPGPKSPELRFRVVQPAADTSTLDSSFQGYAVNLKSNPC